MPLSAPSPRTHTKILCARSLSCLPLGTNDNAVQAAKDFYKFFFTNFPDLRVYFKGAEAYTADDVQASERFDKQGMRLLLSLHVMVHAYDNEALFRAHARETVNRHRIFKMDPALWNAFFSVYVAFLKTKQTIDAATEAAWMEMGGEWNAECQRHLKECGLPFAE